MASKTFLSDVNVTGDLDVTANAFFTNAINVEGRVNANLTTTSTSTSTGSLVCDGGIGVAKDSYFGEDLNVAGNIITPTKMYKE